MMNQAYHKGQYLELFFNISISNLSFDDIDKDLANYADDAIPYGYDFENEKVIRWLTWLI